MTAEPRRLLHLRRQSTYEVLAENATFCVSTETRSRVVVDGDEVVVYQDEQDGKFYVRFPDEINDQSRFETIVLQKPMYSLDDED